MDVRNRVALVTGGAHGIGRALCRALCIEGAKVAVADIDFENATRIADELDALALRVDVTREAEIRSAWSRPSSATPSAIEIC